MQLTTISAQGEFFVAHHGVLARPCECTRSGIEQRLELRSIAQECCTGRFHAGLSLAQSRQSRFAIRSEEHTSELQSLMRTSYASFCLTKKHKRTPMNRYILA